jgi:O-antigen/teichoic acid export membrane protein
MVKKIITTLFTKGFVALINLAILLISSRELGGDVRGQVSLLILNIAIIQAINEVYTGYALVHFIPKFSLGKLYRNGLLFTVLCSLGSLLFFLSLSFFSQKQWLIQLKEQLVHITILSFIMIIYSFHTVIILAKENIRLYNFLNFFQPAILLAALSIYVFVLNQDTLMSFIFSLYISYFLSMIISVYGMYLIFKYNDVKTTLFNRAHIFKNGFQNQIANLSHMLSNRFNFYLISSNALVGVFSTATSLIESVLIISSSAASIILTHVANRSDDVNHVRITYLLSKICFIFSALVVLIILFIPSSAFVYVLGQDYALAKSIMLALSPGILCISFSTIISHYFSALGNQRLIAIANFSGLLTTIVSSYFLISKFQIYGACYATALSYFVASLVLVVMFMKENKLSVLSLFKFRNDLTFLKILK